MVSLVKLLKAGSLIASFLIAVPSLAEVNDKAPAVTAEDQGESPRDVEITRKIRQAVTEDDSLSVVAKNVQIITRQGKVVLKGVVDSPREKEVVTALATKVAGKANVKSDVAIESKE